jgi:hypothetical protein
MKTGILFLSLLACGCTTLISCRHEPVIPEQPVSFTNEILPIITSNCGQAGCHGAFDNIRLTHYADFVNNGRVVGGNALGSKMYQRICSQKKDDMMPVPPQKPLASEQNMTIYIWIQQGAENN